MNIEKMTDLEIMQAIVRGELPHPTLSKKIPMKLVQGEEGKAVFNAIANEKHLNPQSGVYGGFTATAFDSVTGCVAHIPLGTGSCL